MLQNDFQQAFIVLSLRRNGLCAGSVAFGLLLLTASHNIHKFSSFWWSDLGKRTESSVLGLRGRAGPGYRSSCFFSARGVWSECWSFRPSAHPGRTEGGRGGGRAEGGVLPVKPKVKGCHGPANGDGELTLNLTRPVGGWGSLCRSDGCTVCFEAAPPLKRQKPSVAHLPLCLSFFLSFSLPLSLVLSVSSRPICVWFSHRLRGEASPPGERNRRREGGREREEVHTSLFYRTQPGPGLGAVPHLEGFGAVEKVKPTGAAEQEELPRRLSYGQESLTETQTEWGGSVLHWANTQIWLLNLCPASAFSASSQGLPIQLLPPGLGNSNSRCWK